MTQTFCNSDTYTVVGKQTDNQDLVDLLLDNRGIDANCADDFLNPTWEHNHDPFLMHNMQAVVDRLCQMIANNESLVIYSDYDADGIPGATVMTDFLKKIGFENYSVYIPNRNTEGFGLNPAACQQCIDNGANIVMTIDCGISDVEEIALLQQQGVEVIVTDHHLPSPQGLPDCLILNPKQPDCQYPCSDLCGSGVVFKLVQAMLAHSPDRYGIAEGWEKWLLDMVGLATICDMVPLIGENRIFAHYGLQVLRKSPRIGLKTLSIKKRFNLAGLSTRDCGFSIGPCINAASRLGDPMVAFTALSESGDSAVAAAEQLEQLNKRRRTVTAAASRSAYKKIDAAPDSPVVVVGDTDWQLGIVGLIANSVASRYNKPAFVWTRIGDMYKGSVRSSGGVSVHDLMSRAAEGTFVSWGGHPAAGGFVCDSTQIHQLQDRLADSWDIVTAQSEDTATPDSAEQTPLDSIISIDEVNMDNWKYIAQLEPYGVGNSEPLFGLCDIVVDGVRIFGKDDNHVSLSFKNSQRRMIQAVRFNYNSMGVTLPTVGQKVSLVVSFEMNTYNGSAELRLQIKDMVI